MNVCGSPSAVASVQWGCRHETCSCRTMQLARYRRCGGQVAPLYTEFSLVHCHYKPCARPLQGLCNMTYIRVSFWAISYIALQLLEQVPPHVPMALQLYPSTSSYMLTGTVLLGLSTNLGFPQTDAALLQCAILEQTGLGHSHPEVTQLLVHNNKCPHTCLSLSLVHTTLFYAVMICRRVITLRSTTRHPARTAPPI